MTPSQRIVLGSTDFSSERVCLTLKFGLGASPHIGVQLVAVLDLRVENCRCLGLCLWRSGCRLRNYVGLGLW